MQIKSHLLILILMAFSLFSKAQMVENKAYDLMLSGLLGHTVNEIAVKDVQEEKDILYIDSREEIEYEISHIKDALWVGYDQLNLKPLNEVDKNQPIIVYCSVGYRSEKVAEKLQEGGFKDVKNLYGGIFEWVNQGNAVYDMEGEKTSKVHAYNKMWGVWLNKGEKKYD